MRRLLFNNLLRMSKAKARLCAVSVTPLSLTVNTVRNPLNKKEKKV